MGQDARHKHTQLLTYSWYSATSIYSYMMLLSTSGVHYICYFYVSNFMLSSTRWTILGLFLPPTWASTYTHSCQIELFPLKMAAKCWVTSLCMCNRWVEEYVCACSLVTQSSWHMGEVSFFFNSLNLIWYDFILNCKRVERGVWAWNQITTPTKAWFYSSLRQAKRTGRKFEIMNCLA